MRAARDGHLAAAAALWRLAAVCFCLCFGLPTAAAQALSDGERKAGEALVTKWVEAQNRGDFAAYQALYAQSFNGIKRVGKVAKTLDRAGWLVDRKAMFKAEQRVTVTNPTFSRSGQTLVIELTQRWEQGAFADVGRKRLVLDLRPSAGPILAEEMLTSRVVPPLKICVELLWPAKRRGEPGEEDGAHQLRRVEAHDVGTDFYLCQVEHQRSGERATTHELGVVKRGKKWTLVGEIATHLVQTEPELGTELDELQKTGSLELRLVPIRKAERAVLILRSETTQGPMLDDGDATGELNRLTEVGLLPLLEYQSTWRNGEATEDTRCRLAQGSGQRQGFFDLEVECLTRIGSWHDEDPADRGEKLTTELRRYRWDGSAYERR